MLERNLARGQEQQVLLDVDMILNNDSKKDCAQELAIKRLTDSLLENPECEAWQRALGELSLKNAANPQMKASIFPGLHKNYLSLAHFDALLTELENRTSAINKPTRDHD